MGETHKVLVWGTGGGARQFLDDCRADGSGRVEVLAYVDNAAARQGTEFEGRAVVGPDRLDEFAYDFIVISSVYAEAILLQLAGMGRDTSRVLTYVQDRLGTLHALDLTLHLCAEQYNVCEGDLEITTERLAVSRKVVEDVAPPIPVEEQEELVGRLADAFLAAWECIDDLPELYKAGSNWKNRLKQTRKPFYDAVMQRDVATLAGLLNNFCRNFMSSSIMGGRQEYESFARTPAHPWLIHNFQVWRYTVDSGTAHGGGGDGCPPKVHEAAMPPIGNPYGFDVDGAIINWNSFPNHYRAWLCMRLNQDAPRPAVAEIGGGFGGFAYSLLRRPGDKVYLNFDLPENLIISSYYLHMAFPDKKFLLFSDPEMEITGDVIAQYDALLMPNFMLPKLADQSVDMFLNTISFSEMELATVGEYLSQIGRTCRGWLYHENLAHGPVGYRGYPGCTFPPVPGFRELTTSVSRFMGLDAYAIGHTYLERLYKREDGPHGDS